MNENELMEENENMLPEYHFNYSITQRLHARHHKKFKHIIDELSLDIYRVKSISRRLNLASQNLNDVII